MKYYLKRLGHQELGSVKNGKAQRGRYIYISKDKNVLDIFPPLSKTVTNDSSIIPIIPLYQKIAKKIYCNYIYHNDKYNVSGGTRNEYRIYCNGALEGKQLLFQPDDILIFTVNGMRLFNEGGQEIGRFEYYYGQRGNMGNRYISNQPLLQRWVVSKDAISKARCIVGCPNNIKINHAFDSVIRKYED